MLPPSMCVHSKSKHILCYNIIVNPVVKILHHYFLPTNLYSASGLKLENETFFANFSQDFKAYIDLLTR